MFKFFKCNCGAEVVHIEREIDILDKNKDAWDASVDFAMFHYGTENMRPTLKEKLRHCWQILKTGKNYPDNIIMNIDEARSMGEFLIKITDAEQLKQDAEKMLQEWKNVKQK